MPSLRSLKTRIKSIKSSKKITNAMKFISVAKLKKASAVFEDARFYTERWKKIAAKVPMTRDIAVKDSAKSMILLLSADKGMCGAFNNSLIKKTKQELSNANSDCVVMCYGQKGFAGMKNQGSNVHLVNSSKSSINDALSITELISEQILSGDVASFKVVYAKFISTLLQEATVLEVFQRVEKISPYFSYEPGFKQLHTLLFRNYIFAIVHGLLLESTLSEHASRMTAMDSATRNTEKIFDKLVLEYNKIRQTVVTMELIEVVSSTQSMN